MVAREQRTLFLQRKAQVVRGVPRRVHSPQRPSGAGNRLAIGHHMIGRIAGIKSRIGAAKGPVTVLLPVQGAHEWDREDGPLRDTEGLAAFLSELRGACPPNARLVELDCHINDAAFSEAALAIIDGWIAAGVIVGAPSAQKENAKAV
jgi:hypothetical protein